MTLIADENGGLRGKYNSAVEEAEDFYIFTGRFDARPPSDEGRLRRLAGDISGFITATQRPFYRDLGRPILRRW